MENYNHAIVQLGSQVGDAYQVLSGLKEGDRVVASANFLIDAESQVQGALQGFEQESPTPSPEKTDHQNGLGDNSKEPFDSLLNDYSAIQAPACSRQNRSSQRFHQRL